MSRSNKFLQLIANRTVKTIYATSIGYGFLAGFVWCAGGQGFVNLDFENAVVAPTTAFFGNLDWNLAVPGWDHSSGGDTSIVYWERMHLANSQYYILMDSRSPVDSPGTQLAGAYSLAFASGLEDGADINSPWVNAYISQTGIIPAGTLSLKMLATGPFQVLVGGVNIPMYSLGGNNYEGDISSFAGTVAEVKIMNTATTPHTPTIADNIAFSPVAVPEPAKIMVLLASSVFFICLRQQKHSPEIKEE